MCPRLLDLFCGAGGAAKGYADAGFEVVGVDINDQPRYPYEFHQADAMTYPVDGFDVVHASPPCQGYSMLRNMGSGRDSPLLVPAVREKLQDCPIYVIENVQFAPLMMPFMLCGASFGLGASGYDLARHRYFECNHLILGVPECCHRRGKTMGVYGGGTNKWHRERLGRNITEAEKREAMGIDWMRRHELNEAIPPAYTRWIGRRLLEAL